MRNTPTIRLTRSSAGGRFRSRTRGVVTTDAAIGGSCSEWDAAATFRQELSRTHESAVLSCHRDMRSFPVRWPIRPSGVLVHRDLPLAPGLQNRIRNPPAFLGAVTAHREQGIA